MSDTVTSDAATRVPVELKTRSGGVRWAKVLDQTLCIGCHACTTACKSENEVPLGVSRTYVKSVDVGAWPTSRRAFQVTRCNQCEQPPCVSACPTGAMYKRDDGIVDFDKSICIGCKACMAACPYDAIFINPDDHSAEKCNFCAHRLEVGLEPACVTVCPTQAIFVGDLNDPESKVSKVINRTPVQVRRPEKETRPKLYYRGAHATTLDPLAAQSPRGSTYAWSQIPKVKQSINAGVADGPHNSSAAAVISYDVAHSVPWGWRVSLYTWTKSLSAGALLVPIVLYLTGIYSIRSNVLSVYGPIIALLFLGLTGVLLIWDLKHPFRFYLLFTHPQWKSWLVRGGYIIGGYGLVGVLLVLSGAIGSSNFEEVVSYIGIPFAAMTAVYTAFLFAQAKARDMWQSPLLAPHLLVQCVFGGSSILYVVLDLFNQPLSPWIDRTVTIAALVHLALIVGEITAAHPTRHAHLAVRAMVRGRYRWYFWIGIVGVVVGALTPVLGLAGAVVGLVSLLAYEHSFVQAAQSVPLA